MPQLGLGLWQTKNGAETEAAVEAALSAGYRSFDSAQFYENEASLGRALAGSGIPRADLFVTTKVWDRDGYDNTLRQFERSVERLGFDYVDLYLIHFPTVGLFTQTWRALETIYRDGRARAIGVCNFGVTELRRLLSSSEVKPALNQVELHPLFSQHDLRDFCATNGIQVESWSPLAQSQGGGLLGHPVINAIAGERGRTPAQVIIRWHAQLGLVVIPKSVTRSRIRENIDVFDFELSSYEMESIDGLNRGQRLGVDPASLATLTAEVQAVYDRVTAS